MTDTEDHKPDWFSSLPTPPASLIEEVLDDLNIRGSKRRASIGRLLWEHARAYSLSKSLEATWQSPHRVRADMAAAAVALDSVLGQLERLPPEFKVALAMAYSERTEGQAGGWKQLLAGMRIAQSLTQGLSTTKPPKKAPNRVLRNSVGGLMLLLEKLTGNRAKVRPRGEDREPELLSAEAQVIGKLLRSVDPTLQTTTLVNTIHGICRASRGKSLAAYSHQLLLGGTVTPH